MLNIYINVNRNPLSKLRLDTKKILNNLNNNEFLSHRYHKNQLTLTNTTLVKGYGLPKIHILLSLDVKSLFTNIPVELVCNIYVKNKKYVNS